MNYKEYYICNEEGMSNCVIRSLCKILDKEYNDIYSDLCNVAKELNIESYNEIEVFETYMKRNNIVPIEYGKDIKIKDLVLDNGKYIVFCYDKKDFYHMVTIINNTLYDKRDSSLELYAITIYKMN